MANQTAERDSNSVPTLLAVSSTDGVSTVAVYANPVTHRLLIDNANTGSITSINGDTTAAQLIIGSGVAVNTTGGTTTVSVIDYSCRVTKSISQANAGTVTVTWDTETYDTDTMHSNVTNNSRITFTHSGKYYVSCSLEAANDNGGAFYIQLKLNGTTVLTSSSSTVVNTGQITVELSCLYSFSANDYVEIVCQDGGASGISNSAATWFQAIRILP